MYEMHFSGSVSDTFRTAQPWTSIMLRKSSIGPMVGKLAPLPDSVHRHLRIDLNDRHSGKCGFRRPPFVAHKYAVDFTCFIAFDGLGCRRDRAQPISSNSYRTSTASRSIDRVVFSTSSENSPRGKVNRLVLRDPDGHSVKKDRRPNGPLARILRNSGQGNTSNSKGRLTGSTKLAVYHQKPIAGDRVGRRTLKMPTRRTRCQSST
ncbi:MAG: hypothetical protein QOE09_3453 [Ilumatobacteraceae bacterium]